MEKSRVEYSVRNATIAMFGKIVAIILGYITRIIFTRVLSGELLGVNGLLLNILGSIGMAELGISTALVYSLYEPFARNDYEKQKALFEKYKKIYFSTSILILVLGIAFFPVFRYLVDSQNIALDNIYLIYGVFVVNAALSYIYGHYNVIFLASQRNYINDLIGSFSLLVLNIIQIVILLTSRNYIAYIFIYIIYTALINVLTSTYALREYPYLKQKPLEQLSKDDNRKLIKNVKAILMHKIGNTLINNIDYIVITSLIGFLEAGIYSIYYLIIGSIRQIFERGIYGIAGSIGNLGVAEDSKKVYPVFEFVLFITVFLFGYAAIVLYEVLNPFVKLSFSDAYVFDLSVCGVLCLNFFFNGVRQATLTFRDSLGLFYKDRYKTIVESLINLFFSIILAKKMGIIGVFLATSISLISVSLWVEPLILYREYFKIKVGVYFKKLFSYLVVLVLCLVTADMLCKLADVNLFVNIIYRGIVITLVCLTFFYTVFRKTEEMKFLLDKIMPVLLKKRKI